MTNITDIVLNRKNVRRIAYEAEYSLLKEISTSIIEAAQKGELFVDFCLENPKKISLVRDFLKEKEYTIISNDKVIRIYW